MPSTLQFGNTSIPYTLTYTARTTLAIHVHPDTSVTVEAPLDTPLPAIEQRLHKRAPWILRQQRDFQRYSFDLPPRQYISGETHRYLGQQYRLKVLLSEDGQASVHMDREFLTLYTPAPQDRTHNKTLLLAWYRTHAREVFAERLAHWFPRFARYALPAPQLVIRQMHTRWGSCTDAGKITLNLKLIQVPKPLIDYVIVHELCHLVEHNHAPAFYALLSKIMPDWDEKREGLSTFEFG